MHQILLFIAVSSEDDEQYRYDDQAATDTGEALDEFFCATNIQVEEARRKKLKKAMMRQKISVVPSSDSQAHKGVSNA